VRNLFSLFRAWSLRTLQKKARIHIPDGAFLLGVVDETNSLRGYWNESYKPKIEPLDAFVAALTDNELSRQLTVDNMPEIFIQISDPTDPERYKVITGLCVLVRNPAFHPGDIRVVKAVDCDDLLHLHDVVVLPANGDRDLASQCSGGDLDGDNYTVVWALDLIPDNLNEEPMNYTPGAVKAKRNVTVKDVLKFFVQYMKNDQLGMIANAHLANADYYADGVKNSRCLELAHLHSMAVDFPKTGQRAVIPKKLRPQRWPEYASSLRDLTNS